MYADIIVDISLDKLDKSFQYHIPDSMVSQLQVGMTVRIPFGAGNRQITGYVIHITSQPAFDVEKMKDILAIEQGIVTIESRLISLAAWIRERYGSTMNQALKTVLPVKAKVREKRQRKIVLAVSRKRAEMYYKEWSMKKNLKARIRLMEALLESSTLDYSETMERLHITASTLKPLEEKGVIRIESDRIYRGVFDGLEEGSQEHRKKPTEEQLHVIRGIQQEFEGERRPCLIHGVTGSGKTLVYMELIQGMLNKGRQVIVLIPEIALTYQTVQRFYEHFGEQVSVLHSRLSAGERYDQMEQAKSGRVQVMIGPRSALFTPFPKLGMIIIDEEHERTYKSETMPRYHAREVAVHRAETEGAQVVMGSATPSVDVYYKTQTGEYLLFDLRSRFENRMLPKVRVVDLRQELKAGNRSIIGEDLKGAIAERLERKEQVMLFLNRRGYAGFVSCRACGYVAKCPHCDVSMSLHNNGKLICHYCGYETAAYETCPSCNSPYIGGFKAGTQQIEKIVQKMFPESRILRMDFDTTRQKDGYTRILEAFAAQKADILIGTQMIVKGHDFPNVTLVGVLAADLSLNGSDFRSGERTFQLLTQAVGRSGRGEISGEAVIQTYQPDHYSIQASVTQNYQNFYEEEMSYRTLMGYPPASAMMAVYGACQDEALLEQAMNYIRDFIQRLDRNKTLRIIGPAPEAVGKVQDSYRRVIYIKHEERKILTAVKDKLEEYIEINTGFRKINIQFDFHL